MVDRFVVVEDVVAGQEVVVAGSEALNLLVSYERRLPDGTLLEFKSTQQSLPQMLVDNEGNVWDVFGQAINGPRTGQRLTPTYSMMAYWFVAGAMYPGVEIYGAGTSSPVLNLTEDPDWDIPTDNLFWGSSWNAIPAIDNPEYLVFKQRDFLDGFFLGSKDLVIGTSINGAARAYPHAILNYHEIVNDQLGGEDITVAWCPLAGTSTIWDAETQQGLTTFGVAGLLHNNNLILYDRASESVWSQVYGKCIHGPARGETVAHFPMIETSWETWQKIVNEPEILAEPTGINFDYSVDEFAWYKSVDDEIYYGVDFLDPRVRAKERVHCIIVGETAKVYRFQDFR